MSQKIIKDSEPSKNSSKVFYATGRRKTSTSRVFIKYKGGVSAEEVVSEDAEERVSKTVDLSTVDFTVNGKKVEDFFNTERRQLRVVEPLVTTGHLDNFEIKATVKGGGINGQCDAMVLGVARALEKFDAELRSPLKKEGLLTRDPRVVERKKPGRHKARKKPQFSKR